MALSMQMKPKVILVMGVTGVGKSTFIKYATGLDVPVGHMQEACTNQVAIYQVPGQNVFLADSPGFDDTYRNDATILQSINECLSSTFENGSEIVGLLYLHPITDVRMKGSAIKNLVLFKKIVGARNMSKTILVTTKWQKDTGGMFETFESRERELVENEKFWKRLLDCGSCTVRFNDTRDSALQIVLRLCGSGGFTPQLVDETVNRCIPLERTAAGQEVNEDLEKARKAHQQDLQDLEEQQLEAFKQKDHETAKLIKEAQDETREQLRQIESEREALREKKQQRAQDFEDFLSVGAVAVTGAATFFTGGLAAPLLGLSCYNLAR